MKRRKLWRSNTSNFGKRCIVGKLTQVDLSDAIQGYAVKVCCYEDLAVEPSCEGRMFGGVIFAKRLSFHQPDYLDVSEANGR